MILMKQVRDHAIWRKSFMDLASDVFGLSFESWYQNGYWTDRYCPYVFLENDTVVASAAVNHIETIWDGVPKHLIQIGTVMTARTYRHRGLSRRLIEEILSDWKDKSDGIYLFANDTVLDFYPRFGFVPAKEYQYERKNPGLKTDFSFTKLDMDDSRDRETLKRCYYLSNPFSALPMNASYGLLMFYCGGPMKDHVLYSPALDMACIAYRDGGMLVCEDLFGGANAPLDRILSSLAGPGTQTVRFGFTPKESGDGRFVQIDPQETGGTLFVMGEIGTVFATRPAMFPSLSHA